MRRDPIPESKTSDDPDSYRRMTGDSDIIGLGKGCQLCGTGLIRYERPMSGRGD